MPPHFFGSSAIGLLGCMQLFPKINFHTMLWIVLICWLLGAIRVAIYQALLRIKDLHTSTLPANVSDLRYPISAIFWFITAILPSHVLLLLNSLRGKVKPRVVRGVLTGLMSKGVFCMGGKFESGVKADFPQLTTRSEERRVGKESRSRIG